MWILLGLLIGFFIILGFLIGYLISTFKTDIKEFTLPKKILNILQFLTNRWHAILLVVLFIFGILIVINYFQFDLNPKVSRQLQNAVLVETMEPAEDFCSAYKHNAKLLEDKCNNLSHKNCYLANCCGVLNKLKCVAGHPDGPIYLTKNKKSITVDSYHHDDPDMLWS